VIFLISLTLSKERKCPLGITISPQPLFATEITSLEIEVRRDLG
jgi:hypothetical protein